VYVTKHSTTSTVLEMFRCSRYLLREHWFKNGVLRKIYETQRNELTGQDSAGNRETIYRLDWLKGQNSGPGRGKILIPFTLSDWFWGPLSQWVLGALSPHVKGPWCEADHSPPISAEVKICRSLHSFLHNSSWHCAWLTRWTTLLLRGRVKFYPEETWLKQSIIIYTNGNLLVTWKWIFWFHKLMRILCLA
jgi:hypothetical protein